MATVTVAGVLALPVLVGLGARGSVRAEIDGLRSANNALEFENGNYRETTGELTTQIQSLEGVIDDLGARPRSTRRRRAPCRSCRRS